MKHRFIFRNPFITESRRRTAKTYLTVANAQLGASQYIGQKTCDINEAMYYLASGIGYLNRAAHHYGFRNITDMKRWIDAHGRLP